MNDHDEIDDVDRGLGFDLTRLMGRRSMLGLVAAGAGLVTLAACGSKSSTTSAAASADTTAGTAGAVAETTATAAATTPAATATTAASTDTTCSLIPEETAGPFPGDGSNGKNILVESGVVRGDIRSSIGSATGVADGIRLSIQLTIVDADGCTPLAGAAVYLWHCNREGLYSMYSKGAENENYLRGVQETDADGLVTFTSIFPAAYSGRWPHIHFEVYPSVDAATSASGLLATSQVALPEATCDLVFATDGYSASVKNLAQISLQSDNVFGDDGGVHQLATMSGDVTSGFVARLDVTV